MERSIGVFDSGVGGLTVLSELRKVMPHENFIYFGDTARVPYGGKGKATILQYSFEAAEILQKKGIKALVVACNTASAYALEELRDALPIPVIGVVEPGAQACARIENNRRIGVIGTKGTVRSGAYEKKLRELLEEPHILSKACPLFVPIVEEGMQNSLIARLAAEEYLKEMLEEGVDSLIMGCTHYPVLEQTLRAVMGEEVHLINPAVETARETQKKLTALNLLSSKEEAGSVEFLVSDDPVQFVEVGGNIIRMEIKNIKKL